jgi:hypothetical protein
MRFPGFILGYHGCDQEVADAIISGEQEVRISDNSHDWLGKGSYFWENNPSRALAWAKFLAKNPGKGAKSKIKRPAVLGAVIDPGYCLDLTEESSLELVREAYQGYVLTCKKENLPIATNEPGYSGDKDFVKRQLDCAVLNFLHNMRESLGFQPFDSVRAPFLEGGELFDGSKLSAKAHVQWCVRNPKKSIIGYFHSRDGRARN